MLNIITSIKNKKRNWNGNPFAVQNLYYNKAKDCFVCPMGQPMLNIGKKKSKSDLGYISTVTRCQAHRCIGCPLRILCHKAKSNRIIEINYKLNAYKKTARERLLSEKGIYYRGKRCIEPEAVFDQIKHNHQWNRFRLRRLQKVNIEFTLVAIAHNLRKWAKKAGFYLLKVKINVFLNSDWNNQVDDTIKLRNPLILTVA